MATVKFAVIDVNDFLSKKQAAEPDIAADWARLEELYNKKLWHQLTLKLMEFVGQPSLQAGDNLIQLYNNFLTTFENKINPLSLIEIVAHIIKQYTNKKDAIAFLEKMETKVKMNDEAFALCKVLQGQIYLEHLNDLDSTEKIIEQLEGSLEDADGVTPVHGRFYKLASEYYRVRGPMARYYRAALRYLGCSDGGASLPQAERRALALRLALAAVIAPTVYDLGELARIIETVSKTDRHSAQLERDGAIHRIIAPSLSNCTQVQINLIAFFNTALSHTASLGCSDGGASLPQAERRALALRLALAAVIAPTVYDLGELLAHPILESLEGTPDAWAIELVRTAAKGDVQGFEAVRQRAKHPDLARAERQLRQKIAILCLMEMAFNRTSAQRRLTFAEVAAAARVPRDEVELLLMKALAENLVKGHIDQVNETMTITWVRPRALGRAGAAALAARLATWATAVSAAADLLTRAPDLCTL